MSKCPPPAGEFPPEEQGLIGEVGPSCARARPDLVSAASLLIPIEIHAILR